MRNTEVVSLSITKDLLREVEEHAKRERRSKSELIREALRQYLLRQRVASAQGLIAARARVIGLESEEVAEALVDEARRKAARTPS
jgi:CopG family transcriptional regulator/antitoxin EndoAI